MAVTTYTVKRGDNLTKIVNAHWSSIAGNTLNAKIDTLVSLNNIKNKNKIYVGQVLTLSGNSQSSSSATKTDEPKVSINILGLQSESSTGRDVFASWDCTIEHTAKYKVSWEWDVPNSAKPNGYETKKQDAGETEDTWAEFTIPDEFQKTANWVQIFITPIAEKKKDKNGKETETPYYTEKTAESKYKVGKQYLFKDNPPLAPENPPTCEVEGTTLTMKIDHIPTKLDASYIVFQVVKDNTSAIYTSDKIPIVPVTSGTGDDHGKVSHTYTVTLGSNYTVRAKSVGANGKESGWTEFSDKAATKPSAPSFIEESCRRVKRVNDKDNPQAAHLEWTAVPSATQYDIEYTTILEDFDNGTGNYSNTSIKADSTTIDIPFSSQQLGNTYYFRVRAVNDDISDADNQKSESSNVISIPLGSIPDAPTTWSTSESAFSGDTTYKYVDTVDTDGKPITIELVDYTPMELNWIHMPTDNSKQSLAELWIKAGDNDPKSFILKNTTDPDTTGERIVEEKFTYGTAVSYKGTLYFKMDTNHSDLKNNTVQWKVRTAGITDIFSDVKWSTERTIYIYEKPTLALSVTKDLAGTGPIIDTLTSFPFYIRGTLSLTDFTLQRLVGYQLRIVSNDYYMTTDDVGRTKIINPGDAVYSKYFDTSFDSFVETTSNNKLIITKTYMGITHNGLDVDYEYKMQLFDVVRSYLKDDALICEIKVNGETQSVNFKNVDISESEASRVKSFIIHKDEKATIDLRIEYGTYSTYNLSNNELIAEMSANNLDLESGISYTIYCNASMSTGLAVGNTHDFTVNWEDVEYAINADISVNPEAYTALIIPYCREKIPVTVGEGDDAYTIYETGNLVENVTLSVYRREYDGSYKEIATGIPNNYTSVTDPHPALDYARYRFTAKDKNTGALSFWDMAGHPVNGHAVIIQWAEEWSTFDTGENTSVEGPSWSGSLLKLPYNIKISDKRKRDKTLVNYVGREHPVSYYGTQLGEASQWSVEIPANDKETIYALRRLSIWSGDVYVREPSGMGFWANVEVSFNKSYNDVKIPVTLSVTRVEGGI